MEGPASVVGAFQHHLVFLLYVVAHVKGREVGEGCKMWWLLLGMPEVILPGEKALSFKK